jgi:hypothetical protein
MLIFLKLYKIFVQLFYNFITTLGITTFDTEVLFATLSITALFHYAVCRYAVLHFIYCFAKCLYA